MAQQFFELYVTSVIYRLIIDRKYSQTDPGALSGNRENIPWEVGNEPTTLSFPAICSCHSDPFQSHLTGGELSGSNVASTVHCSKQAMPLSKRTHRTHLHELLGPFGQTCTCCTAMQLVCGTCRRLSVHFPSKLPCSGKSSERKSLSWHEQSFRQAISLSLNFTFIDFIKWKATSNPSACIHIIIYPSRNIDAEDLYKFRCSVVRVFRQHSNLAGMTPSGKWKSHRPKSCHQFEVQLRPERQTVASWEGSSMA